MPKLLRQIIFWCGIYLLLLIAPLALASWRHGIDLRARGFWVEFGVALGLVALSMMGLQYALTARFRKLALPFGIDSILQFHRQAGILVLVLVLGHAIILPVVNPGYREFYDPRVNAPRTIFLAIAVLSLIGLVVLSLWREKFRLSYEWWRLTHAILAVLAVGIGLVHALQVNYYLQPLWKKVIWVGSVAVVFALLGHIRVIKPLLMWRTPYRVAEVRKERGRVVTLVLEADGHDGRAFKPGQFIWLTLQDKPFSLQQHPFSIASSPSNHKRLELTIKALGDFTATLKDAPVGSRAFVEGPYGVFTLDPDFDGPIVIIVGGIGVTPTMSILRHLRESGSKRAITMIYGNRLFANAVFREELDQMQREMNLRVVHVIEEPTEDWKGETGFITPEIIDRYVPRERQRDCHWYICGPDPMMDIGEKALIDRGVPLWSVYVERFKMV